MKTKHNLFILFVLLTVFCSKVNAQFQITPLPDTISDCSPQYLSVANNKGSYDFIWKFNGEKFGSNLHFTWINKAGLYTVEIFDQQTLIYADSCQLLESALIFKERIDTISFCENDSLVFSYPLEYNIAWSLDADDETFQSGINVTEFTIKKPGFVYLSIYNGQGCMAIDCFIVVMNSKTYNFLGNDRTFVDSILLDAGEGQSYLWSTGDTTRYIIYKDSSAYISVNVMSDKNCMNSDTIKVEKINMGANSLRQKNLHIYPNPTTGKFLFQGIKEGAKVMLFDINSKYLETISITSSSEIDISLYNPGIYILKSDEFVTRIVKQ